MSHSSIMVAQTIWVVTVTEKYRFQSVFVCYTSVDKVFLTSGHFSVHSPKARTRFALYETREAYVLVVIIVIALSVSSRFPFTGGLCLWSM